MDNTKAQFLLTIGLFFLLSASVMIFTGYWTSLSAFGVSERFFNALAYLGVAMGSGAIIYSRQHRSQSKPTK